MSRIEQLISDIEAYIDNCKYQPFSNNKIIVDKDQLEDMLSELRLKTPDEIKRYQKIIANKDAILADAQAKADNMIEEAHIQTNELVSEHEIMQQAYAQANEVVQLATRQAQEIVDNATLEANAIKDSIMQYTDQKLAEVEDIIAHAVEVSQTHYSNLVSDLNRINDVVQTNRAEFHAQNEELGTEEMDAAGNVGDDLNVM